MPRTLAGTARSLLNLRTMAAATSVLTLWGAVGTCAHASAPRSEWNDVIEIARRNAPCVQGMTLTDASEKFDRSTTEYWKWSEACRQRFRSLGLEMWERFPNDPLRFKWLSLTTVLEPFYWVDPEEGARSAAAGEIELAIRDREAVVAWENQYMALRAELMSAPKSYENDYYKSTVRRNELEQMFGRIGKLPLDANLLMLSRHRLANGIWDFAADHTSDTNGNLNGMTNIWWFLESIEGDEPMESAFIEALKLNPNSSARWVAEGRERLIQMRRQPFDIQMKTLDGAMLDTRETRGKVVLVFIWGNWCKSSKSFIPELQKLRQQYGPQGFEVVGIWFSAEEFAPNYQKGSKAALRAEMAEAQKILMAAGASWKNGLLMGDELKAFEDKFAITGTPTKWLLDREGRLITGRSDRLKTGQLELEIAQALRQN